MSDLTTPAPSRADDAHHTPTPWPTEPRPKAETTPTTPRTQAVRRALDAGGGALAADLVFLEMWETEAPPDIAATLRAAQIRRANRGLAAEIRAELHHGRPLNEFERAALDAGRAAGR